MMTMSYAFWCFIIVSNTLHIALSSKDVTEELSCQDMYQEGADAYLEERWQDCIDSMDKSMKEYKKLKYNIVNCRMKCTDEADESEPIFLKDVDDLQFFERALRNTLCLLKCKKKFKSFDSLSFESIKLFEDLKPYDYLQLCYFQKGMIQEAATAAFTFLVANSNHSTMESNLKFYTNLPEVNANDLKNLEEPKFVSLYIHGSDAYTKEDYNAVIYNFEESLVEYLRAEMECRSYCEGPFDQGWFPEFIPSIANHFTFVLRCKRQCATKLNTLNGEKHEDMLASHYHYLQYAYFKVGKLKEACQAAMSYLLFYPIDDTMMENVNYYKTLPKAKKDFFKPREESVKYVERLQYETKIMDFIIKDFVLDEDIEEEDAQQNENESS